MSDSQGDSQERCYISFFSDTKYQGILSPIFFLEKKWDEGEDNYYCYNTELIFDSQKQATFFIDLFKCYLESAKQEIPKFRICYKN